MNKEKRKPNNTKQLEYEPKFNCGKTGFYEDWVRGLYFVKENG